MHRLALAFALGSLLAPAALADHEVEVRHRIPYSRPADGELLLDAYLPRGEGPFPAVVVIHGGGWRSGDRFQLALHAWWFARKGIAAFAIDYRLAPLHPWPAQIHDCKAAVRWVKTHARECRVDPERVGAYGYSAGGHLAALLGTADGSAGLEGDAPEGAPDTRVAAVCAGGAPVEFRDTVPASKALVYWLGSTLDERPEVYHAASPIAHVSPDDPPFLFYHGTADALVSPDEPRRMKEALEAAGVEAEIHPVPGAGHILAALSPTAVQKAARFFQEKLRQR